MKPIIRITIGVLAALIAIISLMVVLFIIDKESESIKPVQQTNNSIEWHNSLLDLQLKYGEENSLLYYSHAIQQSKGLRIGSVESIVNILKSDNQQDIENLSQLLNGWKPSIDLVRKAAEIENVYHPEIMPNGTLPNVSVVKFNTLIRAFSAEILYNTNQGKYDLATDDLIALLKISEDFRGQNASHAEYLISGRISETTLKVFSYILQNHDLGTENIRRVQEALLQIINDQTESFNAVIMHKQITLFKLDFIFKIENIDSRLIEKYGEIEARNLIDQNLQIYYQLVEEHYDRIRYRLGKSINSNETYTNQYSVNISEKQRSLLDELLLTEDVYKTFHHLETIRSIQLRLIYWGLVFDSVKRNEGDILESFNTVVSENSDLFIDPYSEKSFKYALENGEIRIWSIGPDKLDENGDYYIDIYKSPFNAPGDIVYPLN